MVLHDEAEMLWVYERSGGVAEEGDGGGGEEAEDDEEEGEEVGEPVAAVWPGEPGFVVLLQGGGEAGGWEGRLGWWEGREGGGGRVWRDERVGRGCPERGSRAGGRAEEGCAEGRKRTGARDRGRVGRVGAAEHEGGDRLCEVGVHGEL